MKAMVIYCTKTGNTEKIAKRIAKDFNCPQLKVEADVVYGEFSPPARAWSRIVFRRRSRRQ